MSRQKRLSRILEIVVEEGSLEVEQVAKSLGVSLATIRRDLYSLAQKQLLSRTHGGAVAMGGSLGIPLAFKLARGDEAKQKISRAAAQIVSRFDVIGINGGTTTSAVAREIVQRPEFSVVDLSDSRPALTVVTNALNIAADLTVRSQVKIVVTGGVVRPQSYELSGAFAEEVLKEVNLDIAFLGVEAIDTVIGATARNEDEARINRQISARAKVVVVVTDSSKFNKRAFSCICHIEDINVLITDDGIDEKTLKDFRSHGIKTVIV